MVTMAVKVEQRSFLMLRSLPALADRSAEKLVQWVFQGCPLRIHRHANGQASVVTGEMGGAIMLARQDESDIRSALSGNGWESARRPGVFRGLVVKKNRKLTGSAKEALAQCVQNRKIESVGELEDVLVSLSEILDARGSWMAKEKRSVT